MNFHKLKFQFKFILIYTKKYKHIYTYIYLFRTNIHKLLFDQFKKYFFFTLELYLETVAGEAARRSVTSNIIVCVGSSFIISPDVRQSFLLSSRTVFIFSIQTASIGPSKMYQRLSSFAASISVRIKVGNIPSVLEIARRISALDFIKFACLRLYFGQSFHEYWKILYTSLCSICVRYLEKYKIYRDDVTTNYLYVFFIYFTVHEKMLWKNVLFSFAYIFSLAHIAARNRW